MKIFTVYCDSEDCIYNDMGECDCPDCITIDENNVCNDYEERTDPQ